MINSPSFSWAAFLALRASQAIERIEAVPTLNKVGAGSSSTVFPILVSYLYKYPELKHHIAQLCNKQLFIPRTSAAKPVSSESHGKIVGRLKQRIQQLDEQNRELRRKNEALAGQVYRVHHLQAIVERQQQTIEDLQDHLKETQAQVSAFKVTPITQQIEALTDEDLNRPAKPISLTTPLSDERTAYPSSSDKLQFELDELGIKMNSTLSKLLKAAPEEVVLKAIDALKEALATTEVRNPVGFLVEAIRNTWTPNQGYEQKAQMDLFNKWYPLAQSLQLVLVATQLDEVQQLSDYRRELGALR